MISKKLRQRIISLSLSVITLVALFICNSGNYSTERKFNVFNLRPVVIVSGSMIPSIQINSLSIMEYCELSDLKVGDVAVYNHPSMGIMITHRVIEDHRDEAVPWVVTKGDNNEVADPLKITEDLVVGKLVETHNWTVPIFDRIVKSEEIDTMALMLFIIIVGCAVSVAVAILNLVSILVSSLWLVIFNKKHTEDIEDKFKSNILNTDELRREMPELRIVKGDSIRKILGKIILINNLKNFDESCKDLDLAGKVAFAVGGFGNDKKDSM